MGKQGRGKGFGDPKRDKCSPHWYWESLPKEEETIERLGGLVVLMTESDEPLVVYWPGHNELSFNRNVMEPKEIHDFLLAWFDGTPPLEEVMRKEWKRRRR